MPAALPTALRVRFQELIEEGFSGRAAALRLKLSPATGTRWSRSIRETGGIALAPQGRPKGKGKLDPHRKFLLEVLAQDGDITMSELANALADAAGVRVHADGVGRYLRKLGYSYKKNRWSPPNAGARR